MGVRLNTYTKVLIQDLLDKRYKLIKDIEAIDIVIQLFNKENKDKVKKYDNKEKEQNKYENQSPIRNYIINVLKKQDRPISTSQIVKYMKENGFMFKKPEKIYSNIHYNSVHVSCNRLHKRGQIKRSKVKASQGYETILWTIPEKQYKYE